ncbi:MAG: hypothetical protein J0H01_08465 [Rhizobiales bacterium]|nr:hypothetical protein [Hyphomicrobiales bacterium]
MGKIIATRVDGISEVVVSPDGKHAVFRIRVGEDEIVLAWPDYLLNGLIQCAVNAAAQSQKSAHGEHGEMMPIIAQDWEIGRAEDQDSVLIRFYLTSDMTMSYQLLRDQITPIRATLEALERGSAMVKPATTRPN